MIELRNVDFFYGKRAIFQGLNLTIKDGENTLILGDNGCGKTTLCNIIAGIYPVGSGNVAIDGEDTAFWRKKKIPKVGILFQNPDNQFIRYRVVDEIELSFKYVTKKRNIFKTVEDVVNYFDLYDMKNVLINNLSGGEKQKLALACVMANEPDYLILDEPFAHLDPMNESKVRFLIDKIKDTVTVVEISQKNSETGYERYIYMREGKIIYDGDYKGLVISGLVTTETCEAEEWLKSLNIKIPEDITSRDELLKFIGNLYGKN